ncbi:MAG: hypothetical protein NVSMB68_01760 [Thermoanaerobaculia bacterium]
MTGARSVEAVCVADKAVVIISREGRIDASERRRMAVDIAATGAETTPRCFTVCARRVATPPHIIVLVSATPG